MTQFDYDLFHPKLRHKFVVLHDNFVWFYHESDNYDEGYKTVCEEIKNAKMIIINENSDAPDKFWIRTTLQIVNNANVS